MAKPVILTCAVTGSAPTVGKNPAVPVTPQQIAEAAIESARAGAAIAHIHVRDPQSGAASGETALYREVVDRIRDSSVDVIINLTTGYGDRVVLSDLESFTLGEGTNFAGPMIRVQHVIELKPEICSLDFNTMNQAGSQLAVNPVASIRAMAAVISEAGVKPELEVFDSGDIRLALELTQDGLIKRPALFQIVLGVKYGFPATAEALTLARGMLPPDCEWAAFGIGRDEFPMVALAHLMGGHVRVGLEDNLYLAAGELAPSNAALVEKAKRIITDLGGALATPAEARAIFGLPQRSSRNAAQ